MSVDRVDFRPTKAGRIRDIALMVAAGVVLTPYAWMLAHPENTERIAGWALGRDPNCASDKVRTDGYQADAIVVPGAGFDRGSDGMIRPNQYGEIRNVAAAIEFFRHVAPRIILLNGVTYSEDGDGATEYFLQQEFGKLSGGREIPGDKIDQERSSFNTATDMKELARIAKAIGVNDVVIVTNDFHRTRALLLACNYGLSARSVSAEDLVIDQYPERADEVNGIRKSGNDRWADKEAEEIFSMLFDLRGNWQIWWKENE